MAARHFSGWVEIVTSGASLYSKVRWWILFPQGWEQWMPRMRTPSYMPPSRMSSTAAALITSVLPDLSWLTCEARVSGCYTVGVRFFESFESPVTSECSDAAFKLGSNMAWRTSRVFCTFLIGKVGTAASTATAAASSRRYWWGIWSHLRR